jgi:hypothetical protein
MNGPSWLSKKVDVRHTGGSPVKICVESTVNQKFASLREPFGGNSESHSRNRFACHPNTLSIGWDPHVMQISLLAVVVAL